MPRHLLPFAVFTAMVTLAPAAFAGATVHVNDSQTLTQTDLESGMFFGQSFTLAVDTIFEINSGGTIGPVGDPTPFDYQGSTVNLRAGSLYTTPPSTASTYINGTVNIFDDASVAGFLQANTGAVLNMHGGTAEGVIAVAGGTANIHAGNLANTLTAGAGGTINFSGGTAGLFGVAATGSTWNQSGGTVGTFFLAQFAAKVNISGGSFAGEFDADGAEINLFVTDATLGGVSLGLDIGETAIIFERNILLDATLADGSSFSHPLSSFPSIGDGISSMSAITYLTVTRVPAPAPAAILALASLAIPQRRR